MKYLMTSFIFFLLLFSLQGQSVRASVESSEVYLGQPFEYKIIIEGTTEATVPDLSEIEGIDIQYRGASTSMISSFGTNGSGSSKTVTYSWLFTPLRKGALIIPSFSVEVDGKQYKTASGTIQVKNPEPIDGFHLMINTEKHEYWKGEPFILTIKWLFSSSVSNPVFNLPFLKSGQFKVESQTPPPGNDVFKLTIAGLDVLAMQSAEIYRGDQYSSLSFSLQLVPEAAGTFDIGPITLAFDKSARANGFRTTYTSSVIPSNSIQLKIKELPIDAYNEDGTVVMANGTLTAETSVNPQVVHIGDPLSYTISISGAVSPEEIVIPDLISFPQMNNQFSIPDRKAPGQVEDGLVRFIQTIRVKSNLVDAVPQMEMKYFNVQTGTVEKAIIPSAAIRVLETEVVTSADLESTGYTVTENTPATGLEVNESGILHNFSKEKILQSFDGGIKSVLRNPIYWILFLSPIFSYLLLVIFRNQSKIRIIYSKLIGQNDSFTYTYREILKNKPLNIDIVKKEIRKYMMTYCGMEEKFLTADEIFSIVQDMNIEEEIALDLKEIFLSIERSEYSSSKEELNPQILLDKFYTLSRELK